MINLLDILLLFCGCSFLWALTPDDFREEIGGIIGAGVQLVWIIFWIFYFLVYGHHVYIK
jgi:hypothetical protein